MISVLKLQFAIHFFASNFSQVNFSWNLSQAKLLCDNINKHVLVCCLFEKSCLNRGPLRNRLGYVTFGWGLQAFSQTLKTGHPGGMFSHKIIRDYVDFT